LICIRGQALGTEQGFCSIPNVLLLRHCWSGAGLGLLEVLPIVDQLQCKWLFYGVQFITARCSLLCHSSELLCKLRLHLSMGIIFVMLTVAYRIRGLNQDQVNLGLD